MSPGCICPSTGQADAPSIAKPVAVATFIRPALR